MTNTTVRDRQLPLLQQIRTRLAVLPQVTSVATAWTPILSGARRAQRVGLPGQPLSPKEETLYRVSPGYLATMRTPLLSGRDLIVQDNDNEPVPTVINVAFARKYFGSDTVLGREFVRDDGVRHQVVGIAANSHYSDLRSGPEAIAYMPMKPPRAFTLYIRSALDPVSVMKLVSAQASALDPGMRVRDVVTMDDLVGRTIVRERLLAGIGGAFAAMGLVLAAIGLFGLLNYTVTLKTREIGIRTALGARRSWIHGLILRDLAGLFAGGLVIGFSSAVTLLTLARSLLFGVGSVDVRVIAIATTIFAVVALLACWLPARRAAAIDPLSALRHE
jgi:predicted permease